MTSAGPTIDKAVIDRDIIDQSLVDAALAPESPWQLWWRHARLPLAVFVLLAAMFASTRTDLAIAHALYFDSSRMQWIGAHDWWVNDIVHVGGRWFMRALVVAALGLWIAASVRPGLRRWRRPAGYFVTAVVLSVGVVGLLKELTNVDCPWDLIDFGGRFPFVPLFGDRPDALRHGQCFPAAHAAAGYALLALYFVYREKSVTLARIGLIVGLAAGLLFGLAQQSRGAHFVSHDVWSAFLVWIISLTVYTCIFRARLWDRTQPR